MNALIGIAGAALLFIVFGLLRRGRDDGACAGCGEGCGACGEGRGACGAPAGEASSHGRSIDARS